jgi:signal transduction histidine kinase
VLVRKKILIVALTAVALAVTMFGVPLALLISRNVTSQERSEIERMALRAAVQISPADVSGSPVRLPRDAEAEPVGLYDPNGRLVQGTGPVRLEPDLAPSLAGSIAQGTATGALLVAVPVSAHERVIGVVRAASPLSEVGRQIHQDWLVLALLGLAAAAVAGAIAMMQSSRLARPLVALERVATELGDGNLGARAPASGVAEIDRASRALNATAARLGALIAREQAFSAHASHQLRTPLTGLRLQLEAGLRSDAAGLEEAARRAIRSADELSRTIDDVVSVARRSAPQGPLLSVSDLLEDVRRRWTGLLSSQGRDMVIQTEDAPRTATPVAAVRQVLDVLLDNAYRHGTGTVTVRARASSGALAIDVMDEGHAEPLLPPSGVGLGLTLAQSTAAGQGGRLIQGTEDEQTRITLLVPGEEAEDGPGDQPG